MSTDERPAGFSLESASGVTKDGHPFVQITVGTEVGQLSTADARELADSIYASALSAEYDATVIRVLTEMGNSVDDCARFLWAMRLDRTKYENRDDPLSTEE